MDHMAQDPRERAEAIRVLEEYCVQVCGFDMYGIFLFTGCSPCLEIHSHTSLCIPFNINTLMLTCLA
jgi:hypothetical protein